MGLPGFGPESPTPEAGRIPGYPTDPQDCNAFYLIFFSVR